VSKSKPNRFERLLQSACEHQHQVVAPLKQEPIIASWDWKAFVLAGAALLIEALALLYGVSMLTLGAAVFFWLALLSYRRERNPRIKPSTAFYVMSALILVFFTTAVPIGIKMYFLQPKEQKVVSKTNPPELNESIRFVGGYNLRTPDLKVPEPPDKITLHWLFAEDFPQYWISKIDTRINTEGKENAIESAIFLNFPERSRFVGFYLPIGIDTYRVCKAIPDVVGSVLARFDLNTEFSANNIFDKSQTKLADLAPTGRVYVYYEGSPLTLQEAAELDTLFSSHHFGLVLRGDDWLKVSILSRKGPKNKVPSRPHVVHSPLALCIQDLEIRLT
jgi:hypothetical protein